MTEQQGRLHIVETGTAWEVRREGDSMCLGTYLTLREAEEHAQRQADLDGVELLEHERGGEVVPPHDHTGDVGPAGADPMQGEAPTG